MNNVWLGQAKFYCGDQVLNDIFINICYIRQIVDF